MKTQTILLAVIVASVALAGCATTNNESTSNQTTSTPTSSTSTATTPSTTPAPTTPAPSSITFTASQSAAPGPNVTNITYTLDGPDRAAAGWVTITIVNNAFEPHQAALFSLGSLPYESFVGAMMARPGNDSSNPHMMDMSALMPVGGVAAAFPGANATATVHLEPGTYALTCLIPGPDGAPHAKHGMVRKLTVENSTLANTTEPTADTVIAATDYHFNLSHNVTAGAHTFRFVNNGTHHHEAVLIKLAGNATAKDFTDYFAPDNHPTGPPPATEALGGATLSPGMHEYFTGNLTAGHWALLCFEQDSPSAPPHFVLGMTLEFNIP